MKIGKVDLESEVLVIAEVGNNHEGNFNLAQELVGLAAESGAKAVKFQTFRTDHYVSASDSARYARLKTFELSFEQFTKLSQQARAAGLLFISTPFDLVSAEFLGGIVDAIKVASGDNNFFPLLGAVAATNKPTILSSGMTDLETIAASADFIGDHWKRAGLSPGLAVLHCVAAYPAPAAEANLRCLPVMKKRLNLTVGYSDHTMGNSAAVLSVACGARIVEKHFTVKKDYSEFRDHQLSADPADLRELVFRIKEAEELLGKPVKEVQPSEAANAKSLRRSTVAARDVAAGESLSLQDLTWIRPAGGLAPGQEQSLLGRKLTRPLKKGEMLTLEHVQPN